MGIYSKKNLSSSYRNLPLVTQAQRRPLINVEGVGKWWGDEDEGRKGQIEDEKIKKQKGRGNC